MNIYTNINDETALLSSYITESSEILEAGCGQRWPLLLSVPYRLTGIDLDPVALDIRVNQQKDLHEAILGDLRTHSFADASFDVIYNSFVLEHVAGAEQVMDNFVRWLKPGGLLMVQIPVSNSVDGFITKHTPHWFHIAYYRAKGHKHAGKPGYAPYPTYYDPIVSIGGMLDFCDRKGLKVREMYGQHYWVPQRQKRIARVVSAISAGKLSHNYNSVGWVIQKCSGQSAYPDDVN